MVVILIVQGPNNGDIDAASPTFESSRISSISNNRGERLSSTTNTTSVSFFSSSSSSLQVDPENVLATTKEGKSQNSFTHYSYIVEAMLIIPSILF